MRIFGYLIPFRFMPGAWGLNGDTYLLAEADYALTGEALDRRKSEIRCRDNPQGLAIENAQIDVKWNHIDQYTYDLKIVDLLRDPGTKHHARGLLDVEFKHGHIEAPEYDRRVITLEYPEGPERERALLDADFQHAVIGEKEYEKGIATLNGEPWVGVLNSEFTSAGDGIGGFSLELDWNEKFIEYLQGNGYKGSHPAEIVDRWLADINAASAPDEEVALPLAGRRPYPTR